jgi:hypothetical protein
MEKHFFAEEMRHKGWEVETVNNMVMVLLRFPRKESVEELLVYVEIYTDKKVSDTLREQMRNCYNESPPVEMIVSISFSKPTDDVRSRQ